MILPRDKEYSEEQIEGIRTVRHMIEQHIAWNNALRLQIQKQRVVAQMAQEEVQ